MCADVRSVVVFAVGNESRGDDALGPLLLRHLSGSFERGDARCRVDLIEDFQLQIEHALDLRDRQLALFIDAGMGTPAPFAFYRAVPGDAVDPSSHALSPEGLLAVYRKAVDSAPPPAFVLCVRGERFELGEALSAAAQANLAAARSFADVLLGELSVAAWGFRAAQCAAATG